VSSSSRCYRWRVAQHSIYSAACSLVVACFRSLTTCTRVIFSACNRVTIRRKDGLTDGPLNLLHGNVTEISISCRRWTARRAVSCISSCRQRWTLSIINWPHHCRAKLTTRCDSRRAVVKVSFSKFGIWDKVPEGNTFLCNTQISSHNNLISRKTYVKNQLVRFNRFGTTPAYDKQTDTDKCLVPR